MSCAYVHCAASGTPDDVFILLVLTKTETYAHTKSG
jgi:hypothetical protein